MCGAHPPAAPTSSKHFRGFTTGLRPLTTCSVQLWPRVGCRAHWVLPSFTSADSAWALGSAAGEQRSVQARRTLAEVADCVQRWRNRRQHTPAPPRLVLEGGRWRLSGCRGGGSVVSDISSFDCRRCSRETGPDLAYRSIFPKALGAAICHLSPPELEAMANQELEQYATLRQSSALQSELRILSVSRRKALPAIQFAQRLVLGLRYVRSAYQVRLSAFIHLAGISLADPTPPGEGDQAPHAQIHLPSRDLQRWLTSPPRIALVREIRWALLPCEVAVRRLRAAAPCQRVREPALAQALLDSGGAFLVAVAGIAHWGLPRPTWVDAVSALAVPCRCSPPSHLDCIAACWTCGGACLPSWDSPANPCPWCRGHVGPVCASCNTVVHNRGSCRWNSGAHASYIASGDVNIRLCPDCWWVWASSLAAAPRRHPPPTLGANLLQHLRHSASHCIPGAGSGATAASSLPTRKVRRWVLRQLEGGDLDSIGSLLQELRAWAPTVADDWPPIALTRPSAL